MRAIALVLLFGMVCAMDVHAKSLTPANLVPVAWNKALCVVEGVLLGAALFCLVMGL